MHDSFDTMIEHLDNMSARFPSHIDHLRLTNDTLPPSKTCHCQHENKKDDQYLECIVCKAKTHVWCGEWNEYLGRLPPGCYLCVRCMRSRRPRIEQVKTIMRAANHQWMEFQLVQWSINSFEKIAEDVMKCHALWRENPNDLDLNSKLTTLLIALLSLEMTDTILLAQLSELISIMMRSSLDRQREGWESLRMNSQSPVRQTTIFTTRLSSSPPRKRKRRKKGEEIPCSHQHCLLPTSTHLEWVKCESCKRWYHAICTGHIIYSDLSTYKCC